MLRHKPTQSYSGITVIMSNPSRFDTQYLLGAGGGRLFDEFIAPFNRYQIDIRLKEDLSPLVEGTKVILLLGESAARMWIREPEAILGQVRGSIFSYDGRFTGQIGMNVPMIPTFFPQDAADPKDYETEFNRQIGGESGEGEDEEDANPKSRHGKTARRNYRFWIKMDTRKLLQILQSGIPKRLFEPVYHIRPASETIIKKLTECRGGLLFIDIETFVPSCDIQCVGFSFNDEPDIYVFPLFDWDLSWAYTANPLLLRALAISFKYNTVVAHNGAGFDFPVFSWKYHIPFVKCIDTMIMQHRCYSDIEKSLGHMVSLWTYELFHKDEKSGWWTPQQCKDTMQYCGKDVYTMKLSYYAMLEYAKTIPGLTELWDISNRAIVPYMTTMLQGIRYNDEHRKAVMHENDRLMMQYNRMLKILVGEHNLVALKGKGKSSLAASNKQCVEYFHVMLGYKVVGKGKVKLDGTKGASLEKKNLLKLRLQYDNPVIDIIMAYRECAKESGSLKFQPWNFSDRKIPTTNPNDQKQQEINQASFVFNH
jgi:hypothetical protein